MNLPSISIYGLAGMGGAALYLGSYAALQAGLLRGQGYAYALLNAAAAGLVLLSMKEAFNLSAAFIQIAWIVISLGGVIRHYVLTHRSAFTDEERTFLETTVPGLEAVKARRLLDLAAWRDGEPDTVLTRTDHPVEELLYLATGRARVQVEGTVLATLEDGAMIGEMSALTGEPAAASVVLTTPARYMAVPIRALADLLERDAEIRRHLESGLAAEVVRKLARTNRSLSQVIDAAGLYSDR